MAWDQLSINKPHLAYLIIGGFTSLFMLVSLFVKEKMYIGEATVATIVGIIFGPHAANLFDPGSWGNTDQITLECSRVVLVVQCFAVGVELPKAYMERHWRSVVFLLVPVMTFGWLVTSLVIWWMIKPLSWLESLACAACVTATDPVLASSVVGKGKFAKRVPKHLRDLLSAESGCNDGMAFPFIYLSYYLIHYRPDANAVAYHWFCNTILYECIFGAIYGVLIGYLGRHAIKWADGQGLIDRESFLVFYFVLALFCAGTGSLLGTDDLLVGFAAGVGFSNDGWFTHKTEESHVSNVIDLLLNLTYFVYLGSIIPWGQYNAPEIGLVPWRLVVIALFVVFFRRIPIMMALKPLIPDIKTWREALFAGHFGPIGVGAIFAAMLLRAELENDGTTPLAVLPEPGAHNYAIVQIVWPLTTFLVITSILVHGSSVAVFTLGKRINTLTLTMSYTQANEDGPSWMNRLPRIQSTARGSMSKSKDDDRSMESSTEKLPDDATGTLPPIGLPGNFLRRQKEEDTPLSGGRSPDRPRRRRWDSGMGPGGPITQSAIAPQRRSDIASPTGSVSDTLNEKTSSRSNSREDEEPDTIEIREAIDKRKEEEKLNPKHREEPELEVYEEGNDMIIEDEEGNILSVNDIRGETEEQKMQHVLHDQQELRKETSGEHAKGKLHPHTKNEGEDIEHAISHGLEHPTKAPRDLMKKLGHWKHRDDAGPSGSKRPEHKHGPAHAYQFGNTIIVEDEDGEVVKKYEIPRQDRTRFGRGGVQNGPGHIDRAAVRQGLKRMTTWTGFGKGEGASEGPATAEASGQPSRQSAKKRKQSVIDEDDERIRFTVGSGGRRMSRQDFIREIQQLDPKARSEVIQESDVPEAVKEEVLQDAIQQSSLLKKSPPAAKRQSSRRSTPPPQPRIDSPQPLEDPNDQQATTAEVQRVASHEDRPAGAEGLTLVDSNNNDIPFHSVPDSLSKYSQGRSETAAQRRRRIASSRKDSDDDGTPRIPPHRAPSSSTLQRQSSTLEATGETQAERRRRLAALGEDKEGKQDSDSDDDGGERKPDKGHRPVAEPSVGGGGERRTGIRFADTPASSQGRVQWGEGVGRRGKR